MAIRAECLVLASNPEFAAEMKAYLAARTIVRRAIASFFTHIAMASRAKWDDAPEEHRGVVARSWFLGRWIPTFLVIDGPIGRFFMHVMHDASLLAARLGPHVRAFGGAGSPRDKTFRTLCNGFAHWGFAWEIGGPTRLLSQTTGSVTCPPQSLS